MIAAWLSVVISIWALIAIAGTLGRWCDARTQAAIERSIRDAHAKAEAEAARAPQQAADIDMLAPRWYCSTWHETPPRWYWAAVAIVELLIWAKYFLTVIAVFWAIILLLLAGIAAGEPAARPGSASLFTILALAPGLILMASFFIAGRLFKEVPYARHY